MKYELDNVKINDGIPGSIMFVYEQSNRGIIESPFD